MIGVDSMQFGSYLSAFLLIFAGAGALSGPVEQFFRPPEARPIFVVFDFDSEFDGGVLGRRVAEIFRGHAMRRNVYTCVDPVTFSEEVARSGERVVYDSAPEAVLSLAHRLFQADYVVWGKVTRQGHDTYILAVRIARRENDAARVILEQTYTCHGIHDVPRKIDLSLDAIQQIPERKEYDLLRNTNWKHRPNLVRNPGFEFGTVTPDGWEPVNGLTTFWVDGVSPTGKCVKLDTDVLETQALEWEKRFRAGAPAAQAPKKLPTKPPKYDTIGGTFGVHLYSDWIPIKQGVTYRLDVDVKGPRGNAKVFVKGYAAFRADDFPEQRREVYRAPLHLHMYGREGEWEHHAKVFHPTQPLLLLGIRSTFDEGLAGERLAALVRAEMAKNDVILVDREPTEKARQSMGLALGVNTQRTEIAHLVRRIRGRGVAIWGEIADEEGGRMVHVLSLDVRANSWTNYLHRTWKWRGDEEGMRTLAGEIAKVLLEQIRPVRWLRVKLDCYWPPGEYYFDNVCITEVPPEEDIE